MWFHRAILAGGLLLVTACGAPAPAPVPVQAVLGSNGVQQVTMRVGDGMSFDPPAIAVRAGQPVQLTLENKGGAEHDFALDEGMARPLKVVAGPRRSASGTFTI